MYKCKEVDVDERAVIDQLDSRFVNGFVCVCVRSVVMDTFCFDAA